MSEFLKPTNGKTWAEAADQARRHNLPQLERMDVGELGDIGSSLEAFAMAAGRNADIIEMSEIINDMFSGDTLIVAVELARMAISEEMARREAAHNKAAARVASQ